MAKQALVIRVVSGRAHGPGTAELWQTRTIGLVRAVRGCFGVLILLLAALARAQDDPFSDAAIDAGLADAQERLGKLTDADESKRWRGPLETRVSLIGELKATRAEQQALPSLKDIEARRVAAQRAIDELRDQPARTEVPLASADGVAAYDRTLADARAQRDAKRNEVEARTARQTEADAERKAIPAHATDAKRRLDEFEKKDDDLSRYRARNARMQLRIVQERTAFLDQAAPVWAALAPVLDLELDLARLRYDIAEKEQKLAVAEAAKLREEEARKIREKAEAEARAAERARDPLERFRLERSAETATLRSEDAALKSRIDEIDAANKERQELTTAVEQERVTLEKRLARGDEGTADLLRSVLDRARRARVLLRSKLSQVDGQAGENQRALASVLDRLYALELPPQDNEELKTLLAAVPPDRQDEARRVFSDAVQGSGGLVAALRAKRTTLERIEQNLSVLTASLLEQEASVEQLLVFVQDRILWVRSEPRIDASLISKAAREAVGIASARAKVWIEAGPSRLAGAGGALAMLVLLYVVAGRIRRKAISPPAAPGWRPAAGRVLLGLVAAALPSAGLYGISLALRTLDLPAAIAGPIPPFFDLVALLLLVRRCAGFLLVDGGVAVAMLGLPSSVAAQILRSVRLVTVAALFFRVPAVVLAEEPFNAKLLPRLLDPAWYAALGFSFLLLMRRRGPIVQDLTRPGSWIRGAWGLAGLATALLTLASVGLDLLGYRVGASFLILNVARTAGLLVLIAGFYSTLLALVGRIAARVRSRAMQAGGAVAAWRLSATVVEELTQLVAAVVAVVSVLLFLRFWGLSGALARWLDGVQLITLADGNFVTLWNVAAALLWIAGGHYVVRNLSALYDTVVSPLVGKTDAAGRYVFLALSRYAILLVAYGSALLALKVSFASIGWLLAAISFGVGFGLQEIVANFVSGLIILLERPIRVGDFIEVDGTVAVVDRINIRSTTVTNFDRQTIIIPNKQLITQNLTNWSRNDRIMRRRLRVGVAYGSDVEKVLRVLDEEVRRHPNALADPPPAIRFAQFGDSSLDFDVFFFATIEDGLQTLADLHRQVNDRFAKEKIEIPFPQRDLHLRSGFEHLDRGGTGNV